MSKLLRASLYTTACAVLIACSNSTPDTATTDAVNETMRVSDAALSAAAQTPETWLTYGGDYKEQRHSRLTGITKDNVADLGVAWTFDLSTGRGVESTPIVHDGIMYVTGAWSILHALDAKTGEEIWTYDPEVAGEDAIKGCCDVVNRGVAIYDGKVYLGVFDGRLEALDAKTGAVVWSKVTVDQSQPYTITMAPRIVKGKVIIGNSGGELGVRGYVSAFDAQTGSMDWRFYTVPNPKKQPDGAASDSIMTELVNDTWGDTGGWVTDGGGGTAWDSIVYDEANDQILVGVGNGSPWNAKIRDPEGKGDNLFLSSILALDADTGTYKWHFQTTPRDQWDFTATQSIILADLPLGENGADRRVVMQAPKNGFFYVLDAETGEFISGNNFVPMNWATGLDENGRPIEAPNARVTDGEPNPIFPGPLGAHNWHPMAYSPVEKLAYIPAQMIPQLFQDNQVEPDPDAYWNLGYNLSAGIPPEFPTGTVDAFRGFNQGWLVAWDPIKQEARWTVQHDGPWNGGILSLDTGIVLQGQREGDVSAYDAATGDKLWTTDVKSGALSGMSTYEIDGEQYVTITTGWGSAFALSAGYGYKSAVPPQVGRVVTFKLGGTEIIPDKMASSIERSPKGERFGTPDQIMTGLGLYSESCLVCHGPLAVSSGVLPDLRWSYATADKNEWTDIVMNGALSENGMVSFKEQISPEGMEAIRAYVMSQGHLAVKNGEAGK
ncbi:PQQ-dependent dehydrogenase, methanol/ethanol family [Litorimonas cladophorae]|nr:PQQ-dependent dehydrogenase, methanol/ethanol family [Litorimonas cladophorae]